jgi:pyruvate kinase
MASAAVRIAYEERAKLIVAFTETGRTTRYLSKYRPVMPVISATHDLNLSRKENLKRGVKGLF